MSVFRCQMSNFISHCALGQFSLLGAMSVTMSVHVWKICFLVDLRLLFKEYIANISIPIDILRFFAFLMIYCVLIFFV